MKYYNKINRNFQIKVRLYCNKRSNNRGADSTPRFFVKPISIEGLERIAFTSKAKDEYQKYSTKYYAGKKEKFLSDGAIDDLFEDLKMTIPYGYDPDIVGSREAYHDQVKFNPAYQSFYKDFWGNNLSKVQNSSDESYPFIEVTLNELVKTKYLTTLPDVFAPLYEEEEIEEFYEPTPVVCDETNITVTTGENFNSLGFVVNGKHRGNLVIGKHKVYTFTNASSGLFRDGGCFSGLYPFRLASGSADGFFDEAVGGATFTSGVNVSGLGTLTGAETLVLTTDENTPGLLHYYCPALSGIGGPIGVLDDCSGVAGSVTHTPLTPYAVWGSQVTTGTLGENTTVSANGVPNHCTRNSLMNWESFPNENNPYGITGQSYAWAIPNNPTPAESENHVRTPVGPIGVTINGAPFYNPYSTLGADTSLTELTDDCHGHPQNDGKYHYHKNPKCTYVEVSGEHSPIVGYAFDGYPIYGPRDDNGVLVTTSDLDQYHGHNQVNRGYHYHATEDAPYVLGAYYKGVPLSDNFESQDSPPVSAYPAGNQAQ